MRKKLKKLFSGRNRERFSPYIVGLVVFLAMATIIRKGIVTFDFTGGKSPYAIVMAFSSVMAAFLASVFGAFVAAKESNVVKVFIKTPQFDLVKEYIFTAVVVNLLTTCVCVVGELGLVRDNIVVCVLTMCFSVAILQIFTLTRILKNLI